jgi:hypothetical protein
VFTLPTRLILIESMLDEQPKLRLVEDLIEDRPYVALSHTWGPKQNFTTTSLNIATMKTNIDWHVLPQTFKDAIRLCADFRYSYIWIDSLCIIQDSQEDWETESADMKDVYRNADLVLAASSSNGDDEGFLNVRDDSLEHDDLTVLAKFTIDWLGSTYGVHVSEGEDHYMRTFTGGPLSQRGWAYQERLLARRYLSFNTSEAHFECQTAWRCECGVGDYLDTRHYAYNLQEKLEADTRSLYRAWYTSIVPHYSGRALTKSSDKLPAISAVAEFVQEILFDDYLAGLWRNDIYDGLMWSRDSELTVSPLAPAYRAPSWTWSSLDGHIRFVDSMSVARATTIATAECELASQNPTGAVKSGFMVIKGCLTSAWVSFPPTGYLHRDRLNIAKVRDEVLIDTADFMPDTLLATAEIQDQPQLLDPRLSLSRITCPRMPSGTWLKFGDYSIYPRYSEHTTHPIPTSMPVVWCLYLGYNSKITKPHMDAVGKGSSELDANSHFALVLGREPSRIETYTRLGLMQLSQDEYEAVFADGKDSTVTIR